MKKTFKHLSIALLSVVMLASLMPGTFTEEVLSNAFLKDLKEKIKTINEERPEDRVYLHLDKPMYKPGETIWFSAYVRNGVDLKASKKSEILYAELIDPKGNVVQKHNLIARKGKANADFFLDHQVMGGIYTVKAYTNWQKNDNSCYEKEIQVQKVVLPRLKMKLEFQRKAYGPGDQVIAKLDLNTLENKPLSDYECNYVAQLNGEKLLGKKLTTDGTGTAYVKFDLPAELATNDGLVNVMIDFEGKTESISRSIPITLGNIDLSFFPEGGDLVEGLETNVAFKALDEFGKPADIEGVVKDKEGDVVAEFSSFHNGMGAFEFEPKIGEEYDVFITKPAGISKAYQLPESLKRGWVLNVENDDDDMKVIVNSTEDETMSIMCQVRGQDYFSREIHVTRGSNTYKVPLDKFPIGVAQVTLFDSRNIERAERLVFVNKDKQMNIDIQTDKDQYLPREKVKMTLKVTDERGLPIPANLSMAVVDDKLLSFADDKSSNLLSSLLLEQDIRSKVEEPKFYFDPKEEKADQALDFLLMTDGWRRFTWEQLNENEFPAVTYNGEQARVEGVVFNPDSKPVAGATVTIQDGTNRKVKTDQNGRYVINGLDLYAPVNLLVTAEGLQSQSVYINNYGTNYNTYLYRPYAYTTSATRSKSHKGVNKMAAPDFMAVPQDLPKGEAVDLEVWDAEAAGGLLKNVEIVNELNAVAVQPNNDRAFKLENKEVAEAEELMDDGLDEIVVEQQVAGFMWDMKKKDANLDFRGNRNQQAGVVYYRTKQFAAPDYGQAQTPEVRSDFRSTVYWNGDIEVNNKGLAYVEFYNNDDVTSFRATVEGVGVGMAGRAEKTFYTQLPFAMFAKAPNQVVFEDIVQVPLTLKNTTDQTVTGNLTVKTPKGFKVLNVAEGSHTIPPKSTKTIYLEYEVLNEIGEDNLQIAFEANGLKDAFNQEIKIGAKGFPVTMAFSGQELSGEYVVNISNPVNGSVVASLTAFPNVVSDLMTGIESIIREPSGCFEQTSMSNYPNIMALNYMKETGFNDDALLASIDGKLDRGYKKLTSYETKEKGYEWFGSAPGHEALTAYGLMQFNDMKTVYADVSNKMVERTANWIMSRKDGKGGFKKNPQALDQFGRASDEVTNGYIVYALSEAGYQQDILKEFELAYEAAVKSNDGYQLAMMANTLNNFNDKREAVVMKQLLKLQKGDGSFSSDHSITRSGGSSLQIETTAIAVLAMLKSDKPDAGALNKAVEFLVKNRNSYGGFGSTQGTVLALKALTAYAASSKKTEEAGTLECYVDGKLVASKHYEAGEKGTIEFKGLEKYLNEGKHKVKVAYKGTKSAMPYTVAIDYNTTLPESAEECNVDVSTNLSAKSCKVGETVRLTTEVKNKQGKGLPMTMAVVGIPSGLSAQPWQLKELQEKGKIGFYEITDNYVVFYFRDLAPDAAHTINLDLKAEVPGSFEAPASSGYLYYTNEYKCWSSTGKINIRK
ncbi:MAG: carboxypeptidase regulatory-like domain-containing protein [Flavobacteriales bacterium]|nr:carboxypeptidase regulatory-like domain-containing protein [Flavobacteriales bacterium]